MYVLACVRILLTGRCPCVVIALQVRSEPPLYCQSAKNEINILRELDGRYGTLKLLRDFDHLVRFSFLSFLIFSPFCVLLEKLGAFYLSSGYEKH